MRVLGLNRKHWIDDLRDALRAGMVNSVELLRELKTLDVSGVERAVYPEIKSKAIDYLRALGYRRLVENPGFSSLGRPE